MAEFRICAEWVIPVSRPPIHRGTVVVRDGRIVSVEPSEEGVAIRPGIVLPGFINAHTHLELGALSDAAGRGGSVSPYADWLVSMVHSRKNYTSEGAESSVRAGIGQLKASGVTTVGEISSFGDDLEILKSSGLRAILFHEMYRDDDLYRALPVISSETEKSRRSDSHEPLTSREEGWVNVSPPRLIHRPFPHAPYSCAPEFLQKVWDFVRSRNLPVAMHIAESEEELKFIHGEPNGIEQTVYPAVGRAPFPRNRAKTPLQYLEQYGVFEGGRWTGIHMVEVADEDIEIIRRRDLGIVLCPRSNFCLGCRRPPLEKYLFHPRIGLGTDSLASNANLNMFDEMRFLRDSFQPLLGDAAAAFSLYAATLGGSKALFIDSFTGSLEPGRAADLLSLEPDFPITDPFEAVLKCEPRDVNGLWVAGAPVFRGWA